MRSIFKVLGENKANMKAAVICGTPYQIFNTLNLILNEKDNYKFDIYIFNRFETARKIVYKLKSIPRIERVFLLNDYNKDNVRGKTLKGLIKNIHSAYVYMHPHSSLKGYFENDAEWKYTIKNNQYKWIMAPTPSFFLQCFEKINNHAVLDYYEDGLGSYTGNFNSDYASLGRKIFSKLFNYGYNVIPVRNLYVYEPRLCDSTVAQNIVALPKPSSDFIQKITSVFEYKSENLEGDEIVWLGQRRLDKTVIRILEQIVSNNSTRKIIIRKHPKDNNDETYKKIGIEVDGGESMWEMCVANSNMSNTMLVSSYSTAVFTPKLLFDKEPTIVLVYKLFSDIDPIHLKKTEYFVNLLKGIYINKDKIIIPRSFEEFIDVIKKPVEQCND